MLSICQGGSDLGCCLSKDGVARYHTSARRDILIGVLEGVYAQKTIQLEQKNKTIRASCGAPSALAKTSC